MAKLVKTKQPKLYDFLFSHRQKSALTALIDWHIMKPFVHVSSKLPAVNGCCTWMVPIAQHPVNKNAVICLNLNLDPTPLFDLSLEDIAQKLYKSNDELEEGEERLPLKLIHLNKCPVVAPAKSLTEENAQRLGLDRAKCLRHLSLIQQQTNLAQKLISFYEQSLPNNNLDADHALYSGGFINQNDKQLGQRIIQSVPEHLINLSGQFQDERLNTLLFRYRGRNFPHTLTDDELQKWQRHREYRLFDPSSPASIGAERFIATIHDLSAEYQHAPAKLKILKDLLTYAENL